MFIQVEDTHQKLVHIKACEITGYADLGENRVIYFNGFHGGLGVVTSLDDIESAVRNELTLYEVAEPVKDKRLEAINSLIDEAC